MKIAREEIFGPVICVFKFDSMEEAVSSTDTDTAESRASFVLATFWCTKP